jgi:hypothetical protein
MAVYAPKLYGFVNSTFASLEAAHPELDFPFEDHPFSGLTYNFGPRACTIPHKDRNDLSWSLCSVTSLGSYDHTKGGHLVLWDLNLAIEFPPYSTILFPSAMIRHSNVDIGPEEHRSSITQYNSHGLFRWVAYDYELKGERLMSGKDWWDNPKHMFMKAPTSSETSGRFPLNE